MAEIVMRRALMASRSVRKLRLVPRRRSRTAFLSAMLAFIAVLSMSAVSAWHGATVHDDDPVHAASILHLHSGEDPVDPDSAIHVAAHMVGQGVALPFVSAAPVSVAAVVSAWPTGRIAALETLAPNSLLRPPRA